MAYIIGSKLLQDTDDFKAIPIGLSLPIKNGKNGYFDVNYTSADQIKTNISNLLKTKRGERVMQPLFGTGLHELLFNQTTEYIEEEIVNTIENSFSTWLPYVKLDSIEVELTSEYIDRNTIGIKIDYTLGDSIDTESVFFEIER